MNPRQALNFLKTRTGRLVGFAAILVAAAVIYLSTRSAEIGFEKTSAASTKKPAPDSPQVVHTVQRPMTVYQPPPPKPEPTPLPVRTNEVTTASSTPPIQPPPALPISLVADSLAPVTPTPPSQTIYAPYGRLIPCETVITVDSASIQTPIIGLITEDIYHAGRLVIPAGTEVHGIAQTDRLRERIASGNAWTLVWRTGEELRLKGIALDREFSSDQEGWGITDGSAGMRGRVIKSDDLAEIKLFAATLLSGAAAALTEKESTLFGSLDRRSLSNAPLKGAQDVLQVFAQRIQDAIQRDGFYVRVASGKQFYLYVLQTIDRSGAAFGKGAVTNAVQIDFPLGLARPEKPSPEDSLPFPPSEHP